jgi:MFS family permease
MSTRQLSYRHYLLGLLLLILAFNYVDRLALGLVLQEIKKDLRLSDTELGFLTGLAFAIFYSLMGLPIARWADRGNRARVIWITTLLWSAAVALCGLITNFTQLLLVRIGVAVGEAGCMPPAHSLIADHFTRAERPRAVSIYLLGSSLSMIIGYFLAGWLNELYGWRITFMIISLPGLALAALAWRTLREPRNAGRDATSGASSPPAVSEAPGMMEVCLALWRNATFRDLMLCFLAASFFGYGILQWQPAFFIRSFGFQTGELGTWLAVIYGATGLLGTWQGGEWASRKAANNERLQLKAMALAFSSFGIISACIYVSDNRYIALALLALAAFGGALVNGPLFATIQTLVPERMRAMSVALLYLFANLVGMGLGPLVAGALSDAFRRWAGEESLRYALLVLSPGYLWGGWHLWRASATVTHDLENVRLENTVAAKFTQPAVPRPSAAP